MGLTDFVRFRRDTVVTSPMGLAWAQRLAESTTPKDAGAQEMFARALAVGILAAGACVYVASTGILLALAPPTAWLMPPGVAICLIGLAATLRGGRRGMFWGLTAAIGYTELIAFGITWLQGGVVASGANPIWGLVAPVVAGLVFGPRPAAFWFGVFIVGMTGLILLQKVGVTLPPPANDAPAAVTTFNLAMFSTFVMLCLVWFVQQRRIAEAQLLEERQRSDALLINVLPEMVAERLKAGDRIADKHLDASVLFADLVGFTPLSSNLEPDVVVAMLDDLFREFDGIAERLGVEKIKTIGDCYMAAAGVPNARPDHAAALARVALAMIDAVSRRLFFGHRVSLRIGIHSGPLVAGVIGNRRLLYDLWGDTVNVASRMESSGIPGRVHVSERTVTYLNGAFDLEERGVIQVKGKGALRTYFVVPPEPPPSVPPTVAAATIPADDTTAAGAGAP